MTAMSYVIAFLAVAIMGFANQRGGICAVAAIEELVEKRRANRLFALLEASLFAGGGLVILNFFGRLATPPATYDAGWETAFGGVLFGMGAFWNGACLFGTVARFGSGEWAFAFTPLGFYLGCLTTAGLHASQASPEKSPLLVASSWLAVVVIVLFVARLAAHGAYITRKRISLDSVWSPHVATAVIGIAFVVSLAAVGNWTYAEFLSDLAHGVTIGWDLKSFLYLTLFLGAVAGGWTAGNFRHRMPDRRSVLRRLGGGTLMGVGSALIPGGNTGVVLIGMPLLLPYAWLAFLAISLSVLVAVQATTGGKPSATMGG